MGNDDAVKAGHARDWDEVARLLPSLGHDAIFAVTAQAAGALLDAVAVRAGSRLLDIGCGPAAWAADVVARGIELVGIDLSAEMVEQARARHSGVAGAARVEFRQGDAEALPFEASTFDAAVSSYSVNGLPHPEVGVAEAYRVLRPGGRYAFATWCVQEGNDLFQLTRAAVARHVSAGGDEPRRWAPAESEALLRAAGFVGVRARVLPIVARVERPEEVLHLAWTTGRSLRLLKSFGDEIHQKIAASLLEAADQLRRGSYIELAMPSVLAVGEKPA
ncbi:MAG TPA: methyltransferase domain-containing protein [Kofleriaceae bacterium]|nr:methyltransferase domain-containing protein [Kofleriaceae bacterium]